MTALSEQDVKATTLARAAALGIAPAQALELFEHIWARAVRTSPDADLPALAAVHQLSRIVTTPSETKDQFVHRVRQIMASVDTQPLADYAASTQKQTLALAAQALRPELRDMISRGKAVELIRRSAAT